MNLTSNHTSVTSMILNMLQTLDSCNKVTVKCQLEYDFLFSTVFTTRQSFFGLRACDKDENVEVELRTSYGNAEFIKVK